jgi:hypothetical protein
MGRKTIKLSMMAENSEQIFVYDVFEDDKVDKLKEKLSQDTKINKTEIVISYNFQELLNDNKISDYNIQDQSLLTFRKIQKKNFFDGINLATITAKQLQQHFLSDKELLENIKKSNPQLAKAILHSDESILGKFLQPIQEKEKQKQLTVNFKLTFRKNYF